MKPIVAGMAVAVVLTVGMVYLIKGIASSPKSATADGGNVTVVGGVQIVDIKAKGGYAPAVSTVKAGMPTKIRFETNGTFDCSSSIRIPSLGINKMLPSSGATDIDLGTLQPGTLNGTCGMGMYRFQIQAGS